ncbi:MAG: hypothetical protein Q9181_000643 [Wetmoreana brouardii]
MTTPEGGKMVRDWPAPIMESEPLLSDYFHALHDTSLMLLDVLSEKLGIDPEEIRSRHWFEGKAEDHVSPTYRGNGTKSKPLPGYAIVILGDAALKFTNGVLSAGHHRVIPAPGEQGKWPRYILVHFLRPEDDCVIKTLEGRDVPKLKEGQEQNGEGMSGKEWILMQAQRLREKYIGRRLSFSFHRK